MALDIGSVSVPDITQDDLVAFHEAHFSSTSSDDFEARFLGATGDNSLDEDEDGLGYYEDGTKRTLSDEQIAMFRHSEIQSLLRELRRAKEAEDHEAPKFAVTQLVTNSIYDEIEASLHTDESVKSIEAGQQTPLPDKARGKQHRGQQKNGPRKQHIKPDLRKRTWDKVDKGMGSLDYGEESSQTTYAARTEQPRRRISYEDI